VGKEISEVRKQLLEKADAAEQAYNEGYGLLDQYRTGRRDRICSWWGQYRCPTSPWRWARHTGVAPSWHSSCETNLA
jgi:hypothetical protein